MPATIRSQVASQEIDLPVDEARVSTRGLQVMLIEYQAVSGIPRGKLLFHGEVADLFM